MTFGDLQKSPEIEMIRLVNEACRIVGAYCSAYSFSFTIDQFPRAKPGRGLRRQFSGDPRPLPDE